MMGNLGYELDLSVFRRKRVGIRSGFQVARTKRFDQLFNSETLPRLINQTKEAIKQRQFTYQDRTVFNLCTEMLINS